MTLRTSDLGSHFTANLARWVKGLGRGAVRRKIFLTVYSTRKKRWPASEIAFITKLPQKQVASEGRSMCVSGLFNQSDGTSVIYEKIPEVHDVKSKIIKFADDPAAFGEYLRTHDSSGARMVSMTKITNNFRNVGVANTGKMSGPVRGTAKTIKAGPSATKLLTALDDLKKEIRRSELPSEKKEEALASANDLLAEAKKPTGKAIMSRVKNGVATLSALASGSTSLHTIYSQVRPFIERHFPALTGG